HEHAAGAELLGRRAIVVRQRREGSHLSLPAGVADGGFIPRHERRLLRLAVRAPFARRRRPLGDDLAGPHGAPGVRTGREREPITRDVTGEEFYSTLYAISESKLEPGVIWTGSNDGPFYITRDNG